MTPPLSTKQHTLRRLLPADAALYHAVRLEGISRHPNQFRIAVEDEAGLPIERVAERLASAWVVGGFAGATLEGIGGISRFDGAKLRHKALLFGMYVREGARGTGLSGAIVEALLTEARVMGVDQVILTLAADNTRARRLYERWGFEQYGIEPRAIKVGSDYFDEALMTHRLV
ncbi:MAG: GNAT family protein [Gemmatimonadota bacterium]